MKGKKNFTKEGHGENMSEQANHILIRQKDTKQILDTLQTSVWTFEHVKEVVDQWLKRFHWNYATIFFDLNSSHTIVDVD